MTCLTDCNVSLIGLKSIIENNSRVAIVGNGGWAHKVSQLLKKYGNAYNIEIFSAREVLARKYLLSGEFDLVWIMTRPDIQIQILQFLKYSNLRIILEKPLARDLAELSELERVIRDFAGHIYTSQPWRFSDLWLDIKSNLLELTSLNTTRVSPITRTYLTPELDWIPHDLYLLADLGIDPSSLKVNHVLKSEDGATQYTLSSQISDCRIKISVGIAKIRTNRWDFQTQMGHSGFVDFDSGSSAIYDENGLKLHTYWQDPQNDPLHAMLQSYLVGPKLELGNEFSFYRKFLT